MEDAAALVFVSGRGNADFFLRALSEEDLRILRAEGLEGAGMAAEIQAASMSSSPSYAIS